MISIGMITRRVAAILTLVTAFSGRAEEVVQETATIQFDAALIAPWNPSNYPAWVRKVGTEDGILDPVERCWVADEALPPAKGKCWIDIDRSALRSDLALTLMFESAATADVVVQLWDDKSRVVAIDLFMNIIEESTWFKTHTFVIPLVKYPSASRIVIRRISGSVKVHGVVLTPVLSKTEGDFGELLAFARMLGDPLSPENPVVQAVRAASRKKKQEEITAVVRTSLPQDPPIVRTTSTNSRSPDIKELAAFYDFEDAPTAEGMIRDKSGNGIDLKVRGNPVSIISGILGKAALLDGSHFEAQRNPLEGVQDYTVSIWFKTGSPTENYKLAAAAWWAGGTNASGWVVGTHYSHAWADNRQGDLAINSGWTRTIPFLKGEWNHLVIVYNSKYMREYINGQLSFECPGNGKSLGPGRPMTVGSWMNGFHFRGVMDELRIYRRALETDEIVSLYNAPSQISEKGAHRP